MMQFFTYMAGICVVFSMGFLAGLVFAAGRRADLEDENAHLLQAPHQCPAALHQENPYV